MHFAESSKWTGKVKPKWEPPEGLFTKSAEEIADVLFSDSEDLQQAMSRINFYVNRAGKNLDSERKRVLNKAKDLLSDK